jgi:tetratricopeptide (TPR) repeat protein
MRQAYTPACLIFYFVETLPSKSWSGRTTATKRMFRNKRIASVFLFLASLLAVADPLFAQAPKTAPSAVATSSMTVDKAIALGEQGHCKEALSVLKRGMSNDATGEAKKKIGILGLRCSLAIDNRDSAMDFIRALSKQFPKDPDVLFVVVHAYSDLSTRTAQDLAANAPQSMAAHKLNAEALEMQGKWDEAQHEYENLIQKEPNSPGPHFLLGRALLSRPDADAKMTDRAKQEFQKEIEIDPKNAAAHYVLGELARREENWDEAIAQFSAAAKLDSNFAEAYLGWGFALVTMKRYQEAIPPLRIAERLTPGNPTVHYSLGTALIRIGQKEAAEKEFALHRSLTKTENTPATNEKSQ